MRKALSALVAIAIVVVGCAKAPTPEPTREPSGDMAFLEHMADVAKNEMTIYQEVLALMYEVVEEDRDTFCTLTKELEHVAEELKSALERAPKPSHLALKKAHRYWLEAMEWQLDSARCWHEGCASGDVAKMEEGILYQQEVDRLWEDAKDAFNEYKRSQ